MTDQTSLVAVDRKKPLSKDANALALIRSTTCAECTDLEFSRFIKVCEHVGLDPLRNQIYCFIFDKNDLRKRRMVAVTAIGGYRTIADRTKTYAPSDREPRVVVRSSLADRDKVRSINPAGLISVTVWVKKYVQGEWHTFSGKANWEEFAPFKTIAGYDRETGIENPIRYLDKSSMWYRSPETMLEKVAEAKALRRGWSDEYGGELYDPAEIDRAKAIDLLPHEFARQGEAAARQRALGGPQIPMLWTADAELEGIPAGRFFDRVMEFVRHHEKDDLAAIGELRARNEIGFTQFYAQSKTRYRELVMLLRPFEDRYQGRPTTNFVDRAQGRRPPESVQKVEAEPIATRRVARHEDGSREDIDSNPQWERVHD